MVQVKAKACVFPHFFLIAVFFALQLALVICLADRATAAETEAAGAAAGEDISYVATVYSKMPGKSLMLHCKITKPESLSEEALRNLGRAIYTENHGQEYEMVTIFWHMGTDQEIAKPSAKSEITKAREKFVLYNKNK